MKSIPGYKFQEKLYEGLNTVVYRGERELDGKAAIFKMLCSDYPTLEQITELRHEYEISKSLNLSGIVNPYGLEHHGNGVVLILEDFGGESLNKFLSIQKIELEYFLKLALQIVDALNQLHERQIIHKDIKPSNIIINSLTGEVKISDFSIATRLSKETATINTPSFLEGTLAYMSPEQTGRMNRSIDYRTDFYSLGVTFYEMLVGELPFKTKDPMELVHCHIAKIAVPPCELNPDIPKAVSDFVMKLLAKTAEERYQSTYGIKTDLEYCLVQLQKTGEISNFIPGQREQLGQFLIPQKLYGRDREVNTLMEAFDRVSEGATELMLVSGYSGIGKSCLVQEVHKPIVRQRGYFISGKFDQFKRNIPYSSLVQAFQELMQQLLTESCEKIAYWKEKLLEAFESNGQIIIDVIPEVKLIVGEQPAVPQMGPTESQNRFNRVFQKFLQVFAKPEHPLVIFLDDLQWADSASLKLIQLLMSDSDSQYLLLIAAYRDNEVSPTHPWMLTLDEIQKTGAIANNITLKPLDIDCVSQLVADTLKESEKSKPLAKLVFNKTQGNPFFLTQLLATLHAEKLLTFNFSKGFWQWDIEQIQAIGITDYNVVELLARNIQKLSLEAQKVLKLAACIGNRFNLDVLSIVNEKSQSATALDIWEALQSGLILPLSDAYKIPLLLGGQESAAFTFDDLRVGYKFLHDRVQQAAYSLIPKEQKKETHLKIGQLLLEKTSAEERKENIFALVNQLNFGTDLLVNQEKRYELAELNLIAGQKAKAATAYEPAVRYLNVGLGLLTEDSWQNQYELTLNLYVEAAEAEYLNTNFERSTKLTETVLQRATILIDKVKVYEVQIQLYMAQTQFPEAIDTGISALEMLGVSLCPPPEDGQRAIGLPQLADLDNLPVLRDPYQLAALQILISLATPAMIAKPEMLLPIILTAVNFCIERGHSALAAYAYAWYGMTLCGALEEQEAGYHAGLVALKLLDKFNARSLKSKVYNVFNVCIRHWKEPIRETIAPLLEGLQSGLEIGDIEFGSYCTISYCLNLFWQGERLEIVEQQQAKYLPLIQQLKQEYSLYYIQICSQLTLNLRNLSVDKFLLVGEKFNEVEMLPRLREAKNKLLLSLIYLSKSILFYLFKNPKMALDNIALAAENKEAIMGMISFAIHNFYYSLILLAEYPNAQPSDRQNSLKIVQENQQKMQRWAESAPCNFQHKYELVEAEKARVLGQIVEAMELYDRAIAGAKKQEYIQEEALASELAAEFYFSLGREKIAQTYLTDAYYSYIRWGANAKVKDLEERYPIVVSRMPTRETIEIDVTKTTTSTSTNIASGVLDLATVMKASQALSGEIVLSQLLEKLLKIVMENAGATTSCLMLEKNGQMFIEATGAVEQDLVVLGLSTPVETSQQLPISLINYVARTQEYVVLNDAAKQGRFTTDAYIITAQPKSILCAPIINQGQLIGILYLENNLTVSAFTPARLEVLKILSSQVAISLKNALLYANLEAATEKLKQANEQLEDYSHTLEQKVEERTLELKEKNMHLKRTLQELQQTQTQMIQTEKMSSLGQLVAGIAHEINNPINFIYGNLSHAGEYLQDLLKLIDLYDRPDPHSTSKIAAYKEAVDLEFMKEDFSKILDSMQVGADRIRKIVLSLRNFSRLDESQMKEVDIHEGIDSTLLIVQHRMKEKAEAPGIQVIKEYGNLPQVECYAGQLNQVFMNIITNAIDALEEYDSRRSLEEIESNPSIIRIHTELKDRCRVIIRISDNGAGMTKEVSSRVFDPFFTTKPVGSGTGLGLSISYQIVVEKHGGKLKCISEPGQGANFIIEIPVQQRKHLK